MILLGFFWFFLNAKLIIHTDSFDNAKKNLKVIFKKYRDIYANCISLINNNHFYFF